MLTVESHEQDKILLLNPRQRITQKYEGKEKCALLHTPMMYKKCLLGCPFTEQS